MTQPLKEAPASACRFGGGAVTFAASEDGGKTTPIRMLARSPQAIFHPYWGWVVHDMAGMRLHKNVLPIDYEHTEPIGFADTFDASSAGLVVEGRLVRTAEPADRGTRVIELSAAGVPYEASIYFGGDDIRVEWIPEGASTAVNGRMFEGPGYVVRQWWLRGIAVCPYGADMNTESAFSRNHPEKFSLSDYQEAPMPADPKTKKLSAPAETPEAQTPPVETPVAEATPAVTPAAEAKPAEPAAAELSAPAADRAEAKRFRDAFGDQGAVWFCEGLSFEEARTRQTQELQATVAELQTKLSAGKPTGEQTPINFQSTDAAKKQYGGFASKFRFAAAAAATK